MSDADLELDPDRDAPLRGATLIQASAGTGKTWSIEQIVLRRVRAGMSVRSMVLMSFTHAAADELSDRVRSTLRRALQAPQAGEAPADAEERRRVELALLEFDACVITTIHGFCQRMLQEHGAEAGAFGLAGWSLDPDASRTDAMALLDVLSVTAMQHPIWWALWQQHVDISQGLRLALRDAAVAADLARADFRACLARWTEAERSLLGGPDLVPILRELQEHLEQAIGLDSDEPQEDSAEAASQEEDAGETEEGGELPAFDDLAHAIELRRVETESIEASIGLGSALGSVAEFLDPQSELSSLPEGDARARAIASHRRLIGGPGGARLREALAAYDALDAAAKDEVLARTVARIRRVRSERRLFTFDDLLLRLRDAVHASDGALLATLQSRFRLAVIDEFQDTDPVQADIVRTVFRGSRHCDLFLVGDPKQSIYGFRNADVESYQALATTCDHRRRLAVSQRSDPAMVQAVNALFDVPRPFFHDSIVADPVRSRFAAPRMRDGEGRAPAGVRIVVIPKARRKADLFLQVALAIRSQLAHGWMVKVRESDEARPLRASDISVLCRKNSDNPLIADALREVGVPAVVVGTGTVYSSEVAEEIAALLMAIGRTSNRALALAALSGRLVGMDLAMVTRDPDAWVERLRVAAGVLDRKGVVAALRGVLVPAGAADALAGLAGEPDGERLLLDLQQVLESLGAAEASGIRGASMLATWLAERVHGGRSDDDGGASSPWALGDRDAVTVQTLHGSKGLTCGIAWMPGFMGAQPGKASGRNSAEERRLLYVGLTRARWQSNLVWSKDSRASSGPLATLLHARHQGDAWEAAEQAKATLQAKRADEAMRDLHAVASGSGGSIEVETVTPAVVSGVAAGTAIELADAWPVPAIPQAISRLSFTRLHEGLASDAGEGDQSHRDDAPATQGELDAAGTAGPCDEALRRLKLRGTALGNAIHDALERDTVFASLASPDAAPLAQALCELAGRERVAPEAARSAAEALRGVLAIPIAGGAIPTVVDAASARRGVFRELKLHAAWSGSVRELAKAFETESAGWAASMASRLQDASDGDLAGTSTGSLDLVRCVGGEWFIYDYKSNDLGRNAAAYGARPDASGLSPVDQAMVRNDYPLQAALYATMLRRWLRSRGRRDDRVAGVAYLFVRGMDASVPGQGVWHWCPTDAILDAVDRHLSRTEVLA